jgi:tetratricopeptide (TPR) repeat protein
VWTLVNHGNIYLTKGIHLSSAQALDWVNREKSDVLLTMAKNQFESAMKFDTSAPQSRWGLGKTALAAGEFDAAALWLTDLQTTPLYYPFAACYLGDAYYALGNTEKALETWQSQTNASLRYLLWKSQRYQQAGDMARTENMLQLATTLAPYSPEGFYALGGLYWGMGKNPEAIVAFQSAASLDHTTSAQKYMAQGRAAFLQHDWDLAESNFRNALSIEPENTWAFYLLGSVFWNQRQAAEARQAFEATLAQDPNHIWALIALARVAEHEHNYPEAKALLAHAVHIDPSLHLAHFRMGQIYTAQGLVDQAVNAYTLAVQYAPQNLDYRLALAYAYAQNNQAAQAIRLYEQILADDPTNIEAAAQWQLLRETH